MKNQKNFNRFLVVCTVLTVAIIGWAINMSAAGIADTDHNFSGKTWNTGGEICQPCHTPHNASTTVQPLWNHMLTAQTFTVYSNSTMNATVGQPDGASKMCLGCHDGTTALENFGGKTNGTNMLTGSASFGTDLSNDHPISFTYDAALVTADQTTGGGVAGLKAPSDAGVSPLLLNGKVQCSSCHDAHGTGGYSKMLVKSNAASALCLTCHIK